MRYSGKCSSALENVLWPVGELDHDGNVVWTLKQLARLQVSGAPPSFLEVVDHQQNRPNPGVGAGKGRQGRGRRGEGGREGGRAREWERKGG